MENNNNKKTLILSIVGILVLVIAVVGVSFAMYSFSGTGQRTNVITAGSVSVNFAAGTNTFQVSNKYPMTDAVGIAQEDSKADFTVVGNWGTQAMTVNYEVGLSDITAGATLTEDFVKIALLKGNTVVVGSNNAGALTGGVLISSLASNAGDAGMLNSYVLTSGTLTTSGAGDTYTIMAYVADSYDLPADPTQTVENVKKTTKSETFKFKVTVAATQA